LDEKIGRDSVDFRIKSSGLSTLLLLIPFILSKNQNSILNPVLPANPEILSILLLPKSIQRGQDVSAPFPKTA
jgi:hypothetical protein